MQGGIPILERHESGLFEIQGGDDTTTLIISPHADDEIYGCFSFLENSFVYYTGINESKVRTKRPTSSRRLDEVKKVAKFCNFKYDVGKHIVNEFHNNLNGIIKDIEDTINKVKPKTILIPFPDYNQDHQTVYKACMIALRPHDKNHFVPKILLYVGIEYQLWGKQMAPNYFKEVNIDDKRIAYGIYETQMRGQRCFDLVETISKFIGYQSNLDYAEGFKILRWVE